MCEWGKAGAIYVEVEKYDLILTLCDRYSIKNSLLTTSDKT